MPAVKERYTLSDLNGKKVILNIRRDERGRDTLYLHDMTPTGQRGDVFAQAPLDTVYDEYGNRFPNDLD